MYRLFNSILDFIFIERAIRRLNCEVERIETRIDPIDRCEQDIWVIIRSILFRSRLPIFYDGIPFHKANGVHTCMNLIATFIGDSEIVTSIVNLIILHLALDIKTEAFSTVNTIDIICPDLSQSSLGKLQSIYHDDAEIWHLTQEMMELISKSKQKRTLLLLEDISKATSLNVPLESYMKLVSCSWDNGRLIKSNQDDLQILVREAKAHSSNLDIMEKALVIIIDVIYKRNLFQRIDITEVDTTTLGRLKSLLVNAIEFGNENARIAAFRIIISSSISIFASDVDVASAVLSFLYKPKSNLHYLALFALSMSCDDKTCVRALELKGLKAYLYNLLYTQSELPSEWKVPYQLRLLYNKNELIQGDNTAFSSSLQDVVQTSNCLPRLERKHKPEYGTVRDLFERGEPGLF